MRVNRILFLEWLDSRGFLTGSLTPEQIEREHMRDCLGLEGISVEEALKLFSKDLDDPDKDLDIQD